MAFIYVFIRVHVNACLHNASKTNGSFWRNAIFKTLLTKNVFATLFFNVGGENAYQNVNTQHKWRPKSGLSG